MRSPPAASFTLVQLTEDHTPDNSGITESVEQLTSYLNVSGIPTQIVAVGPGPSSNGHRRNGLQPVTNVPLAARAWRYAPRLPSALTNANASLIHLHGVWTYAQWAAGRVAIERRIPFVLSPHNMLHPWLWRQTTAGWAKKASYWRLLAHPVFRHAAVVHAFSSAERNRLRRDIFPGARIEVLPNAVAIGEIDREVAACGPPATDTDYLLFLGRIHPVKGLESLLEAFRVAARAYPTRLVIAGPGIESPYGKALSQSIARDPFLASRVDFAGLVSGSRKWSLLSRARAVCICSHTEGMSLTALEALAAGSPVLTTPEAGPAEIAEHGGVVSDNSVASLTRALTAILAWSTAEMDDRRIAARRLAETRFDWDVVGPQYLELYRSVLA